MMGTSGTGNHARRAHDAHELGAAQQRHLPIEDHDIGAEGSNGIEGGDAVAGLEDIFDAAIQQKIADHLAHVLIVVDHQHAEWLDAIRDFLLRQPG